MPMQRTCVLAVSAIYIFVSGCGGGGGGGGSDDAPEPAAPAPPAPSSASVTVRLKLAARPANIQSLVLTMTPLSLRRPVLPSVNVLTDLRGNEVPTYTRQCDSVGCRDVLSTRSLTLLEGAALSPSLIALEQTIPAGDYIGAHILPANTLGVRDSHALLDDGRECEVHFTPGSRSALDAPIQVHAAADQLWNLNLTLDVGSIDPADCDDGTLDLTAVLGVDESVP